MTKIVSVENMRRCDAAMPSKGISSRKLMFNAGKQIVANVDFIPPVAIICGTGNNAGDGYVVALLLKEKGIYSKVFMTESRFTEDGEYYYNKCVNEGIDFELCTNDTDLSSYKTVVDCIFGTGFRGKVNHPVSDIIEKINKSGAYVVSVDINSGINGDSGLGDNCVVSDITVSIGDYKSGHFLGRAKDVIKRKINCDIGIEIETPDALLVEPNDIKDLFKDRNNYSNKGDFGYIALIGGSLEYSGALKLANLSCSALRAGAGVVKLAAPRSLENAILPYILESTFFPLSATEGRLKFSKDEINALCSNTKAVAIGMGLGRSSDVRDTVAYLIKNYTGRLIIDADGLNELSVLGKDLLKTACGKVILTPHLKEFERISGIPMAEISKDPLATAREFAADTGTILLLKGPTTIITDGNCTFFTDRGSSGMATAGSGDVLSGILAGICGYVRDEQLLISIAAGAYLNGLAGELATEETNTISMLSGDTVRHIPRAINLITGKES